MSSENGPRDLREDGSVSSTSTTENSSSSSSLSVHLRATKSTSDLPLTNRKRRHCSYNQRTRNRGSKHITIPFGKRAEYSSTSAKSKQPFVCSLYVTTYDFVNGHKRMELGVKSLKSSIRKMAVGKVRFQKTLCGLTIAFTKEEDAEYVIKLPLQNIFAGPVQVARFLTGEYKYRPRLLIRDVPWCIPKVELEQALRKQGIRASKVIRTKTQVTVEVMDALDVQRLVDEGLNFFNCTSFSAVPEKYSNQGDVDIVQCFKCQGFWHTSAHCRHGPKCVRCGENHSVETCPRPRSTPICCHCGGPHHAAYKLCPVRLRLVNLTSIGIQLANSNPSGSLQTNLL